MTANVMRKYDNAVTTRQDGKRTGVGCQMIPSGKISTREEKVLPGHEYFS